MSAITSIEWTATVHPDGSVTPGKTWNPVRGCSVISPGCVNCYAMKQAHRFSGVGMPYEGLTKLTKAGPQWTGKIRIVEDALLEPLSWRKPARVFVNSMSDLFHEGVPDEFIDKVFAVMALAERHTFQVLTKRPARMRAYLSATGRSQCIAEAVPTYGTDREGFIALPLPNVWLGTSVESLPFLKRLDELAATPAAVRFVSFEPLLADVGSIARWVTRYGSGYTRIAGDDALAGFTGRPLDWVIIGGESGHGARPFDIQWARSIVQQCQAAGVPVFVKQLGANCCSDDGELGDWPSQTRFLDSDRAATWRVKLGDKKGGDINEWPEDLRVRQFPGNSIDAG